MIQEIALGVHNVTFSWKTQDKPLASNINFNLPYGKSLALQGVSGSGKSTLLRLFAGLLKTSNGTIDLLGNEISQQSDSVNCAHRVGKTSFVYQHDTLFPYATVKENASLLCALTGKPFDGAYFDELVASLALGNVIKRSVNNLSGGERQRAALIRALMIKPVIIFADEPTSQLDYENAKRVMRVLTSWLQLENHALVVSTHDHRLTEDFSMHLTL